MRLTFPSGATCSETLEASDNYFLQNTPLGTTFKSLSTVNLDVLARTPGWRYLLSSNVSYYNYFGPAPTRPTRPSGTPINETFRVDHATDFARYFFATTWNRADVAATQLRESGVVTTAAPSTRFRAIGGGTHDLNRIDSISWSVAGQPGDVHNAPGQTPYNDFAASLAWNRLLDPRTTWTTSVNFDWFDADDLVKSQRLFWQIMTGLKSQLTQRLTVSASVGATFANTWQNSAGFAPPGTTTFIQAGRRQRRGRHGQLELPAAEEYRHCAVSRAPDHPDHLGPAAENDDRRIYDQSRYQCLVQCCLSANFAHTDSSIDHPVAGTAADFFSAQVAYSYRLARDWRTRLSYTYRQRNDDTGTARANTVLVSLVITSI